MKILQSITIKQMLLKNRMVMPGMGTLFGNPSDNTVSDRMKGYIEARAKGGVGLLIVEYTAVEPGGRAASMELGIWDDRFIPGLKEMTDIAHKWGAKIGIQLHHAGRGTSSAVCGTQPVAPSPIAGPSGEIPKELTATEIKKIVKNFGKAARRAKEAGFDCVEIHGAHGYLLSQFMSPYANKRNDEYGGSFEARLKFPIEVIEEVRSVVGDNYPILYRYSASDCIDGGRTIEDALKEAPILVAAGVDTLDVSIGILESANWIITAGHLDYGFNAVNAEAIKKVVDVPIIVVGKIHNPEIAEEIVSSGKADMVALGRALIVDPEFPNKVADGRWEDIRKCIHCLNGCYDEPVTCSQNPDVGHEWDYKYNAAPIAKNVVVIGGGPAGLEVAAVAAKRCHKVTLFEKEELLGGQVNAAMKPPHKEDFKNVIDYRIRQAKAFRVNIETGKEITIKALKKIKPDVVVLATGAKQFIPTIKGIDTANVVNAVEVLTGKVEVSGKVMVIGGGNVGAETASYLVDKGNDVTVVEMADKIASDAPFGARVELMKMLDKATLITKAQVKEIKGRRVIIIDEESERELDEIDTIVLAVGSVPNNKLAFEIKEQMPDIELYVIGDAKGVRKNQQAITEGNIVGRMI